MNKFVASLGLAAIGASGVESVYAADDLGAPASKIWSVSASLRGFYDDNFNTVQGPTNKESAFGFEVSPGVRLNWSGEATTITAGYQYIFRDYDNTPAGQQQSYDQNHLFDIHLEHRFNPRYKIAASDSFVVGQEPDVIRVPTIPNAENQHISGNNIRNYAAIVFDARLTPIFSVEVGYNNSYYNYENTFDEAVNVGPGLQISPSSSGALDRIENAGNVDFRWLACPETTAFVGYQYLNVNYTGDEPISGIFTDPANPTMLFSDGRNNSSHIGYIGVEQVFNPNLSGMIKIGIQHIDFYNDPSGETGNSPYVRANLRYTYAPESHFDIGFSQSRAATDVTGLSSTNFVHDTDLSVVYGSLTHRIVPNLFGTVIGTFQNSGFNGGGPQFDGKTEQYYQLGLNLKYVISRYFSTEVGYNYDKVSSDISGRSYDRNRIYLGLSASY